MDYKFSDFEDEFNLDGNSPYSFDNFIRNEFEASLYSEFKTGELHYFEGVIKFILIFRERTNLISIENSPSRNLAILLWYIENSFSKNEINFYLKKVNEWIEWNERNVFENHYHYGFYDKKEYKYIDKYSEEIIRTSLLKLSHLINIYIYKLGNHEHANSLVVEAEVQPLLIKEEPAEKGQMKIKIEKSKDEKFKEIQNIIAFLINNKKADFISHQDFELLNKYLTQIVYDGDFFDEEKLISIREIDKADVIYTFKLINMVLSGKKRHPAIFRLLASCINRFEDEKVFCSVPDLRLINSFREGGSSLYKNFTNDPTKKYAIINPIYKNLEE